MEELLQWAEQRKHEYTKDANKAKGEEKIRLFFIVNAFVEVIDKIKNIKDR